MSLHPKKVQEDPSFDKGAVLRLFAAMPDGMIVLDAMGIVLYANDSAHRMFGGRRLLGKNLGLPIMAGESHADIEVIDSAGRVGCAELRAATFDWLGQPATVASLRDITERRALERQLALAGQVFENAREGIIVTRPDGVIVSVNRSFTTITGYSLEEALGNTPRLLKSGEHDRAFFERMWESIAGQGFWHGEIVNRRKDGSLYPELLSISRIQDGDGQVAHLVGIFSDLTQHKTDQAALEEARLQLQQSEKLLEEIERRYTVANSPVLSVVGGMYGSAPLSRSAAGVFDELVHRYGRTLELAVENLAFKVDNPVSDQLRELADDLGYLQAGARDVAELHAQTLTRNTKGIPAAKAKAMIEEGRFLVLELMGDLLSFYRKNYSRVPAAAHPERDSTTKALHSRAKKGST
ncbi:MAG: Nitrogen fixation regulatory protein [Candidatus Accumulibacter regalis]|uniref:Nitrogen fixation regulatory protein n=1 Tax=Accumulibacter regalis TaxID=522306 RepID=A0A011QJG2_ACCRE|nr:PAS domain S-box protein [Accumulibacter sp.]EXI89185.1 MAG: Nitrogen fixation regulatory protein [Candidatus Accumulibacter regalis]HRE71504.1 PAS domain S-box protein [Accumulibacter sp.]